MNYKKYNRRTETGFFRKLWYWFIDTFGLSRDRRRRPSKREKVIPRSGYSTNASQKGYHKGCFGSPRFKGYKE